MKPPICEDCRQPIYEHEGVVACQECGKLMHAECVADEQLFVGDPVTCWSCAHLQMLEEEGPHE